MLYQPIFFILAQIINLIKRQREVIISALSYLLITAMLEEMREEISDDVEQMKTLEELIQQVKRDIAAEELAC